MINRLLAKLSSRLSRGGTELRGAAYVGVHEDSNVNPTPQLPSPVEFRQKSNMKLGNRCLLAALSSGFLSIVLLAFYQSPVTVDGILYLKTAAQFQEHGFRAALDSYAWPFYSILIASFSAVFHSTLLHSAYAIDILGISLLSAGFLWVLDELGFSSRLQWMGLIALLAFPQLNLLRQLPVLRDFGYLGFMFLSLGALLAYVRTMRLSLAIAWGVLILTAATFRIEGILLASLLPLWAAASARERTQACLRLLSCYSVFGGSILLVILLLAFNLLPSRFLGRFLDFAHPYAQWIHPLWEHMSTRVTVLASLFHYDYTRVAGYLTCIMAVSCYVMIRLVSTLGWMYTGLALWGIRPATGLLKATPKKVLVGFLWINSGLLLVFTLKDYFLSFRYLMPICLVGLIWVTLGLNKAWGYTRSVILSPYKERLISIHQSLPTKLAADRQVREGTERKTAGYKKDHENSSANLTQQLLSPVEFRKKSLAWTILLWLAISTFIIAGYWREPYNKSYIVKAGQWLQAHTQGPLYSNDAQVLYYARPEQYTLLKDISEKPSQALLARYHYFAIKISRHHPEQYLIWKDQLEASLLRTFSGARGDQVVIFQKQSQNSAERPLANPA